MTRNTMWRNTVYLFVLEMFVVTSTNAQSHQSEGKISYRTDVTFLTKGEEFFIQYNNSVDKILHGVHLSLTSLMS